MSRITSAEKEYRVDRLTRIIANGGRRSDCVAFAAKNWGVAASAVDPYLAAAREKL